MTDENAVEQRCTINDNKCSRGNIAIIWSQYINPVGQNGRTLRRGRTTLTLFFVASPRHNISLTQMYGRNLSITNIWCFKDESRWSVMAGEITSPLTILPILISRKDDILRADIKDLQPPSSQDVPLSNLKKNDIVFLMRTATKYVVFGQ